ncbi:MAG: tetratricopeptide (TPR) repeat protein [Chlamydiales bacterium]|jgi:tetratricopeptide (TPR) repeat protein
MKKHSLSSTRLLLLIPFLAVGCATRSLTVPIVVPPEYFIRDHKGVAVFPTESNLSHPKAADLAQQLSSAMEVALSADGNSFHLVAGAERDQLNKHLNDLGNSYDNFDPAALEALEKSFGREIPATAWFTGKMILVESVDRLGDGVDPWSGEPFVFREGRVKVHWQVSFIDTGTGKQRPKTLTAEAAAQQTRCEPGVEPAALDFTVPFGACVSNLSGQFKRLWTVSTRNESISVFVGDGEFNMPWEGSEYPLLTSGYQRMANEQYPLAQADYMQLVDQLKSAGGEMLARAHYNLGFSYEIEGDFDTALEHYTTAVGLSPNSTLGQGLARCQRRITDRELLDEAKSLRIQP